MSITQETRRESYLTVKPLIMRRRAVIFEILGNREMTANEIAEMLYIRGITPFYERNFAAPRLTELKAEGKVKVVGKRFSGITGRNISVWKQVKLAK